MMAAHPGALVPVRFTGSVASVHEGIVNIDVGGYFVSLVYNRVDRTALSLYVARHEQVDPFNRITPGSAVQGTPSGVEISGYGLIPYTPVQARFSGRMEPGVAEIFRILHPATIDELRIELRDNTRYHRGFVPLLFPRAETAPATTSRYTAPQADPFLERARGIIDTFNGDLSPLVGLGPGFTPAGDDFIAGALLAEDFRYVVRRKPAGLNRDALTAALHRTTTGGATILRLALAGRPPLFVHEICDILADPDKPTRSAPAVADRFGHSSGLDLLTGFVWYSMRI